MGKVREQEPDHIHILREDGKVKKVERERTLKGPWVIEFDGRVVGEVANEITVRETVFEDAQDGKKRSS